MNEGSLCHARCVHNKGQKKREREWVERGTFRFSNSRLDLAREDELRHALQGLVGLLLLGGERKEETTEGLGRMARETHHNTTYVYV